MPNDRPDWQSLSSPALNVQHDTFGNVANDGTRHQGSTFTPSSRLIYGWAVHAVGNATSASQGNEYIDWGLSDGTHDVQLGRMVVELGGGIVLTNSVYAASSAAVGAIYTVTAPNPGDILISSASFWVRGGTPTLGFTILRGGIYQVVYSATGGSLIAPNVVVSNGDAVAWYVIAAGGVGSTVDLTITQQPIGGIQRSTTIDDVVTLPSSWRPPTLNAAGTWFMWFTAVSGTGALSSSVDAVMLYS